MMMLYLPRGVSVCVGMKRRCIHFIKNKHCMKSIIRIQFKSFVLGVHKRKTAPLSGFLTVHALVVVVVVEEIDSGAGG